MTVSILGCGWLGLPLAMELVKNRMKVKGSTTSADKVKTLKKEGIKAFLIDINPKNNILDTEFFKCDVLVFNIPPKRHFKNVEKQFAEIIGFVKKMIEQNNIKQLIFVSSTSVYPSNNKIVTEKDAQPERGSGKALLAAEKIFLEMKDLNTTILRFGGLIGYERNALSLLKKKEQINNASAPLNLIHRDDCIEIIIKIIEKNVWGYVFNACADLHPKRKDFYLNVCEKNNMPIPLLKDDNNKYKIVSSEFLKSELNYRFKYPDPLRID